MVKVKQYKRPIIHAIHSITGAFPPAGTLVAKHYRKSRHGGFTFAIDEYLGDDQFIFLSIEQLPPIKGKMYYAFDAEELLESGACLRTTDILNTAETDKLELAAARKADEAPGPVGKLACLDCHDYTIQDIKDSYDLLRPQIEALKKKRDRITTCGPAAVFKLRRMIDSGQSLDYLEILVPKRLEISHSLGLVEK